MRIWKQRPQKNKDMGLVESPKDKLWLIVSDMHGKMFPKLDSLTLNHIHVGMGARPAMTALVVTHTDK